MNPRFYFACCQFGAEKAVKAEVLGLYPHLRFAFSRPGFITFKEDDSSKPVIQKIQSVFVRLWGQSVGQAKDPAALADLLKTLPSSACVHAFERNTFVPGDEPLGYEPNARITAALAKASGFRRNAVPKLNEKVWDVIWLDDFHVFLGTHLHREGLETTAGNIVTIEQPASAPSRAYQKLAEAIQRFKIEVKPDLLAVEIACSPGGATSLMLSRKMKVMGIDPKEMSPEIDKFEHFYFIQKMAKNVVPEDVGEFNPDWLVMDMNLAPLEALDELAHVVRVLRRQFGKKLALRNGFITLKLNDWKFAASIPLYLKRLEEIGFKNLTPMQLSTNRQEFFVMSRAFG